MWTRMNSWSRSIVSEQRRNMFITAKQIEIIKLYIQDIENMIAAGDVQQVLDAINDLILDNILGNNDEPDKEGIMLQKLYDEIYNQNQIE